MSYDLYLRPRSVPADPAAVLDYFRRRVRFSVEGQQAAYENYDTGVLFTFEINRSEPGSRQSNYPVLFNLAYLRPSFFILEAEPEVTAFVRAFDCCVLDLQTDGMGEGEYRADRLLSGWNSGNAFACRAILPFAEARQKVVTLPSDELHRMWRWNYDRAALQERVGQQSFVPTITVMAVDGRPSTVIIWADGMPMVFPTVDYVIAARQDDKGISLLSWEQAHAILEPYMRAQGGGVFALDYHSAPAAVRDALDRVGPLAREIEVVDMDNVLDAEIADRVLGER